MLGGEKKWLMNVFCKSKIYGRTIEEEQRPTFLSFGAVTEVSFFFSQLYFRFFSPSWRSNFSRKRKKGKKSWLNTHLLAYMSMHYPIEERNQYVYMSWHI